LHVVSVPELVELGGVIFDEPLGLGRVPRFDIAEFRFVTVFHLGSNIPEAKVLRLNIP
jgi:hypothetical protein